MVLSPKKRILIDVTINPLLGILTELASIALLLGTAFLISYLITVLIK
jgi:hypothetical protein